MGFLDWIDVTKLVIGLILTVFGAVSGLILWVNKRMRNVADRAVREAGAPHENTVHRLGKLEGELIDLSQDVGSARTEIKQLDARMYGVERLMESVAKKSDVEQVSRELAGLVGAFNQNTAAIGRQIDGLTQAAYSANKRG